MIDMRQPAAGGPGAGGSNPQAASVSYQTNDLSARAQQEAYNLANQTAAKAMVNNKKDDEVWDMLKDVPKCSGMWPYVFIVLNVFFPEIGTMLVACIGSPKAWSKT